MPEYHREEWWMQVSVDLLDSPLIPFTVPEDHIADRTYVIFLFTLSRMTAI